MNNKIRIILGYTILLIESIILFLLGTFILVNNTILNKKYIIKTMDKIDYYEKIFDSIKVEMSYYTGQSGFEDNILDDTFTVDDVKTNINTYITNFYNGKKTEIDTTSFEEKLNKKIDNVLTDKNFTIANRKDIDKFVSEMSKIYKTKIKIINRLDNYANKLNKVIDYSKKITTILTILLILLYLTNVIIFKRSNISTILYTVAFLIIASNIYIRSRIDIKHLLIYNDSLTSLVKAIINNLLNYSIYAIIIYFILGIIINIIFTKNKEKIKN